jgi:threonyl-tRNA synthetase
MAQAILEIQSDALLAFGPPINNGCYYDFLFKKPLTPEQFPDIEKRMRGIIAEKQQFIESSKIPKEAISFLEESNQIFKVEYCKELLEKGEKTIGFFQNGSFIDMCAGPHLAHTGEIPKDCFKIDSLAGAYWRGDSSRPQLTRIYCLAFESKEKLEEYIKLRQLAEEREHRKIAKELDFFVISDEIGPGLPLWMPNGTAIKDALETFAKEQEFRYGYYRVSTPHIAKENLYITSGHLPYYADGMFPKMELQGESNYYLKAMNCPHHHQIYLSRIRSYKELPLRFAEFGTVYRYEPSGTLSGLLRVRSLCQNDAHIYCTPDQLKDELKATFKMTLDYYNLFRFKNISFRFSTHDPKNGAKFVHNPESWSSSEKIVQEVIDELGIEHFLGFGEAAFYGPKIDFQATTLLGREESIGTTQLDFAQPISFNLKYVGADGNLHQPYIIHRAPLGTHERFLAFLIEHLGGAFPTWMSPLQVKIIPISLNFLDYTKEIEGILKNYLIRADVDESDKSFNKKIREAVISKTPNIIICGAKEVSERQITLRRYCTDKQISMSLDSFIVKLRDNIAERRMDNFTDVEF